VLGPPVRYFFLVFGLNALNPDRERMYAEAQDAFEKVVVRDNGVVRVASLSKNRYHKMVAWNAVDLSEEVLVESPLTQTSVDLFVDCRFERRAAECYSGDLREHSGMHAKVAQEVMAHPQMKELWPQVDHALKDIKARRTANGKEYDPIVVAWFCREGKHRSVAAATTAASYGNGVQVHFLSRGTAAWRKPFCNVCRECLKPRTAEETREMEQTMKFQGVDFKIFS
jgi:hypothetical protein